VDALKRYLYWIVIGALIAATVVLYLVWVTPARNQCRALAKERDDLSDKLKARFDLVGKYRDFMRDNPGKAPPARLKPIANDRYAKACAKYRAELDARKAKIAEIFATHKIEIKGNDPIFNPPAPDIREEWAWREWVNKLYPPVRDITTATRAVPKPPEAVPGWRDEDLLLQLSGTYEKKMPRGPWNYGGERQDAAVSRGEQDQILRRFLIWRSIHIALRSARVEVPGRHPRYKRPTGATGERTAPDRDGKEVVMDAAGRPVVIEEPDRRPHEHRVVQISRIKFENLSDAPKRPYKVLPIRIEFAAHPAVVPEVLQRLQAEERFVFVVNSLQMQQVLLGRDTLLKNRRSCRPDRYYEPPVNVMLECQVLSFDEELDPVP